MFCLNDCNIITVFKTQYLLFVTYKHIKIQVIDKNYIQL